MKMTRKETERELIRRAMRAIARRPRHRGVEAAAQSRQAAKLGGRKPVYPPCDTWKLHRWSKQGDVCRGCGFRRTPEPEPEPPAIGQMIQIGGQWFVR